MRHHDPTPEAAIIHGLCSLHAGMTKEYFYGYCRRAYLIFDRKYQLHTKEGLDFYSLAHEYYIQLLTHHFQPLLAKPREQMMFHVAEAVASHYHDRMMQDTLCRTVRHFPTGQCLFFNNR